MYSKYPKNRHPGPHNQNTYWMDALIDYYESMPKDEERIVLWHAQELANSPNNEMIILAGSVFFGNRDNNENKRHCIKTILTVWTAAEYAIGQKMVPTPLYPNSAPQLFSWLKPQGIQQLIHVLDSRWPLSEIE